MTIFEVLARQYRDVAALFAQVYDNLDNSRDELARVAFRILSVKLIAGIRAEHAVVYPRFAFVGLGDEVSESQRGHTEIEDTINHLRLAQLKTLHWRRIVELLERQVNRHYETVDQELFPFAQLTLSRGEAEQIACDFLTYEPLATTVAGPSITYELSA